MPGFLLRRRPYRRIRASIPPHVTCAHCAAVLSGAVLVLASCGGDSGATKSAGTPAGGALDAQALVDRVAKSTVSIVSKPVGEEGMTSGGAMHAHASGVIWDADKGLALTSDHHVEKAGTIEVSVNGETPLHARLVARAQCNDFAVLALHPKPAGLTAIDVVDSNTLQIGDEVNAIGYLRSASASKASLIRTTGGVSSVDVSAPVSPDLPDLPSVILHQAPIQLQMAGGPLVDNRGRLVGLITLVPGHASSAPYAAVSSHYIMQRMSELEPAPGGELSGWEDQHACHGQMQKIAERVWVSHGAAKKGEMPDEHAHG
jgi:S1-C subfamily serine protease